MKKIFKIDINRIININKLVFIFVSIIIILGRGGASFHNISEIPRFDKIVADHKRVGLGLVSKFFIRQNLVTRRQLRVDFYSPSISIGPIAVSKNNLP